MSADVSKALFVNLPVRLRETLTVSPQGETRPYGVRAAANLQEALAVLAEDDIFAVLIAVETAETVGDHLLREIRAGYPTIEITVLLPEDDAILSRQIPDELRVRVRHQPVDADALAQELADHARRHGQGFAGTLKNIQIDDLIQMCCLSMATISIRVTRDDDEGTIYIRDGEIVHAVSGDETGEDAFYRILGWARGRFETIDDSYEGQNSISKSHEFLLMEAARRSDEDVPAQTPGERPVAPDHTDFGQAEMLKVLLVEDSSLMAKILSSMLTATGVIQVVGTAGNGQDALQMAQTLMPDLILLDVNMPVMDGSTALKHIMIRTPCPVVVMSNVGSGSPDAVIQFLDLGAVDFMAKPVKNKNLLLQQQQIVKRIIRAAAADVKNTRRFRSASARGANPSPAPGFSSPADQLVIVTAGCSGHGELTQLLAQLPDDHNLAIVALQSMPPAFIPALARHLDQQSTFQIMPLADGLPLRTGTCYLATPGQALRTVPTAREMVVEMPTHREGSRSEASYFDLFLYSAADAFPGSLVVIVLSGAETGNLEGLRYVAEQGARILVQDPATCALAEPAAAVIAEGLGEQVLSPEAMADHIRLWVQSTALA